MTLDRTECTVKQLKLLFPDHSESLSETGGFRASGQAGPISSRVLAALWASIQRRSALGPAASAAPCFDMLAPGSLTLVGSGPFPASQLERTAGTARVELATFARSDLGAETRMGRSVDTAMMPAIKWRPPVYDPLLCRIWAMSSGPNALADPHAVSISP